MSRILIFLISLLLPAAKPCLAANLSSCLNNLPQLEPKLKFINTFIRSPQITDFLSLIDQSKPFLPFKNYLLGKEKPTTYLVLLQNNYEMRANGGFFGSYAVIATKPCQLSAVSCQLSADVRFQDIYVPDGQIAGHVDPPAPIQTAFQQGWFRLRDSDWDPDFTAASKTIRWFLEKGNEVNPDILVTLNLETIKKILAVTGNIDIPESNLTINQENVYTVLQNQAENNFFPGSTQKRDALTAAGKALFNKLSHLSPSQYLAIANLLFSQLNQENLLLNSLNPDLQKVLEEKGWAGQIEVPPPYEGGGREGVNDIYMMIEANLGANKANCCVERITKHTVTKKGDFIHHLVKLSFVNNSLLENPSPPRFFGGNYISYLRFYLPQNAANLTVTTSPTLPKTPAQYPKPATSQKETTISLSHNLTEVGFFHLTAAGTKSTVDLSYDLPFSGQYQLTLLKQHGMIASPQEVSLFGKNYSTNLEKTTTLPPPP